MKPCADLEEATHSEIVDWAIPRTLTQAKSTPANLDGSVLILGTCCTCTNEHLCAFSSSFLKDSQW